MNVITKEYAFPIFITDPLFVDDYGKYEFLKSFQDLFDDNGLVREEFPFPYEAPKEIPRIILKNHDKNKKIEIGINKIMLYFTVLDNKYDVNSFLTEVKRVYDFLATKKICRIGLITTYDINNFTENSQKASEFVKSSFFKSDCFNSPKELNVFYNRETDFNGVKINNIITLKSYFDRDLFSLQTDINTSVDSVVSEKVTFDVLNCESVIKECENQNKKLIDKMKEGKIGF